MWFSVSEHLTVTLYSIVMGVFLGILYDCVKLTRILCGVGSYSGTATHLYQIRLPFLRSKRSLISQKSKNTVSVGLVMFIGDIVYAVLCGAVYSLFLFHAIRGQVRWYFILASAIGFFLYYFTVSKLVLTILEVLFFGIRVFLRYIVEIIILPVRVFYMLISKLSAVILTGLIRPARERVKYRFCVKYTEKIRLKIDSEIRFSDM